MLCGTGNMLKKKKEEEEEEGREGGGGKKKIKIDLEILLEVITLRKQMHGFYDPF